MTTYSYDFVDTLHSKGVDVVIGFWGSVEQELGEYWTENLVYALSCGNTVANSLEYANDALREAYPYDEEVLMQIIYGYYTGETMLSQRPCA